MAFDFTGALNNTNKTKNIVDTMSFFRLCHILKEELETAYNSIEGYKVKLEDNSNIVKVFENNDLRLEISFVNKDTININYHPNNIWLAFLSVNFLRFMKRTQFNMKDMYIIFPYKIAEPGPGSLAIYTTSIARSNEFEYSFYRERLKKPTKSELETLLTEDFVSKWPLIHNIDRIKFEKRTTFGSVKALDILCKKFPDLKTVRGYKPDAPYIQRYKNPVYNQFITVYDKRNWIFNSVDAISVFKKYDGYKKE